MAIKIMLDPGHGQGNKFNRGSKLGNEGDNNWEYSLILKKELEKYGIVVGTTRPNKSDNPGLERRGKMAKGYDLFISLHSNAGPSTAKGVEIFPDTKPVVDDHKLAAKLCEAIASVGNANRGVRYRTYVNGKEGYYTGLTKAPRKSNYFGVLYHNLASRYAMLIEHVYHTNLEDCRVYVYKRQELAAATAKTIAEYYGLVKSTTPAAPTKPTTSGRVSTEDFINRISADAIKAWKNYKILPSLTIAQAILESDSGNSELAVKANALFGIKAHTDKSWPKTYKKETWEWANGQNVKVMADFKAYRSWSESIEDRSKYLTNRKIGDILIYKEVIGERDYKKACRKIFEAGYATDPKYPDKLISLIERYNLTKFDKDGDMKKGKIVIAYWNDGDLANAQALLNSLPGAALVRTQDASIYKEDFVIQVGGFDIKGADKKVFGRNRLATLEEVTKAAKELKGE